MVRIEDVAARAGVSTATVSRALRGLPNVSPTTRAQVERAAVELEYVASRSAASLASGRTWSAAVISPYVDRWYFSQVIGALEESLRPAGYDLLLHTRPPGEKEPFDALRLRRRVDAVAVITVPLSGAELDVLRGLGVPLVFVGAAVPGAASVRVDDVAAGRVATEHLLGLGHRRIAHVGGDPREPSNFRTPADRRAGWLSALRQAGVPPCREYEANGWFTPDGGASAVRDLLALPEPPTAVFAASDEMALGVLLEAGRLGVRVPDELSVVGVDDHPLAGLHGLTTVAQDVLAQGRLAARLLLTALEDAAAWTPDDVLVPLRLVVRDSATACAGAVSGSTGSVTTTLPR